MIGWSGVRTLALVAPILAVVCLRPIDAQQPSAQAPGAQPIAAATSVPSVEALFSDASAKEAAVRKALADPDRQPTVLKAVRVVVADYETVVRHYPASSYCDDALWRAGRLSRDAFDLFHDAHERTVGLRLLQQLTSQYPTSKLARQAPEQIAWLNAHAASASAPVTIAPAAPRPNTASQVAAVTAPPSSPAAPTPAASSPNAQPAASSTSAAHARTVTIKAIRRTVMTDVVRVVIEMDGETLFHDDRIDNPTRVFVDLPSTRIVPALSDQTLRFDGDTDVVRQIRIGRQTNSTTRVVLDAAGVSSYSVYPLYSPFRLVIDCLRAAPLRTSTATLPAVPIVAAAPAPPSATPRSVTVKPPPPLLAARSTRWVAALPSGVAVVVGAEPGVPAIDTAPAVANEHDAAWMRRPAPASASAGDTTPKPAAAGSAAVATTTPTVLAPAKPDPGGLSMARQLGLGVARIVIDPGHGGHDPGAQAEGVNEAELVLDVALRVEKLLKKVQGVDVVLTRRENEFVSLQERTAIANRESADLFLSIHANASNVPAARGIETYFLNFARDQGAAAVAARENATSDQTMGALQDVVKAIALNSKVDESRDFATHVQHEMLDSLRPANKTVRDLGVKQAPFVVLIGAAMPSVLAEISFVTNPQEARLLKTPAYRQRIAQALFEGIRKYQFSLKNATAMAQQN